MPMPLTLVHGHFSMVWTSVHSYGQLPMLWTVLLEWKAMKCPQIFCQSVLRRRIVSGQKCLRDLDLSVKILNDLNLFLGHWQEENFIIPHPSHSHPCLASEIIRCWWKLYSLTNVCQLLHDLLSLEFLVLLKMPMLFLPPSQGHESRFQFDGRLLELWIKLFF